MEERDGEGEERLSSKTRSSLGLWMIGGGRDEEGRKDGEGVVKGLI
jgi:hypothetical protein